MAVKLSTPAKWVDDQKVFDHVYNQLKSSKHLGIDTESNSLHAYQEQVCLIQVTDQQSDYLIDPLSKINLSKLSDIFADESIEKIFHAAEYDILCLKRDFGFKFNHLFDTMQSARILGMEKLGLSSLLSDLLGVDQGKSFQKADWGKRPLPEGMRQYARLDTHYLLQLRNILADQLNQKQLMDLAQEDFNRLSSVEPNHRDEPLYKEVSGYHQLEPRNLAVLEELCKFRDQKASRLNRPHFKVISNSTLLSIAKELPVSAEALRNIEGIPIKLLDRYQNDLLEAVKKGINSPPVHLEKRRRPSQAYLNRLDALHEWRKKEGKLMGVQSDIILPRDVLEEIAASHPHDLKELQPLMESVPWRYDRFGRDIINVIEKRKTS